MHIDAQDQVGTPTSTLPMAGSSGKTGGCGCGGRCGGGSPEAAQDARPAVTPDGTPVIVATALPHEIRHQTILEALDGLAAGQALVVVAPHEPTPLLRQVERRSPEAFAVTYDEQGPVDWQVRFTRR